MLLLLTLVAMATCFNAVSSRPLPVDAPVVLHLQSGPHAEGTTTDFFADSGARAINFLKEQVGEEEVLALVRDETAAGDAFWKDILSRSDPDAPVNVYARAMAVVTPDVLNATSFAAYLGSYATVGYPSRLIQLNPQHYFLRRDGATVEAVEQTGVGPYSHVISSPIERQPFMKELAEFPAQTVQDAKLRDGTNTFYAQTAFRDNEDGNGVEVELGIYFPSAVPEEMLEPARQHLAIEVSNWLKFAYEDIVSGAWAYEPSEEA